MRDRYAGLSDVDSTSQNHFPVHWVAFCFLTVITIMKESVIHLIMILLRLGIVDLLDCFHRIVNLGVVSLWKHPVGHILSLRRHLLFSFFQEKEQYNANIANFLMFYGFTVQIVLFLPLRERLKWMCL